MAGVTANGFERPTDDEIDSDLTSLFRAYYGSDITLSPATFLGQTKAIFKVMSSQNWELANAIYDALFVETSTGVNLDRTLYPFTRRPAQSSSVVLTFSGTDSTVIPAGTIAESSTGVQFATVDAVTILDSSGTGSVNVSAIAVVAGTTGNFPVGTITSLPVSIVGVDSVTNNSPATGGTDIESDSAFLSRATQEAQESKGASVASIRNALLAVEGISQATVTENATDSTVDGIPPHSFISVISGGASDTAIAEAIYAIKPAGIGTAGDTTVPVTEDGQTFNISFSRSSSVNIYVDLILTVDASWDPANEDVLKSRVLQYIGGVDGEGIDYPGLAAGQDVLGWKVEASLFNVNAPDDLGITDVTVEIAKHTSPSAGDTDNIDILPGEEAITDLSFINVFTV